MALTEALLQPPPLQLIDERPVAMRPERVRLAELIGGQGLAEIDAGTHNKER